MEIFFIWLLKGFYNYSIGKVVLEIMILNCVINIGIDY